MEARPARSRVRHQVLVPVQVQAGVHDPADSTEDFVLHGSERPLSNILAKADVRADLRSS